MLTQLDHAILGSMAGRAGPAPKELFQAARDEELANHRFTARDVRDFERAEAHLDVRAAVRKDLVPLRIEGLLARSYDEYFESGCGDVSWIRSY